MWRMLVVLGIIGAGFGQELVSQPSLQSDLALPRFSTPYLRVWATNVGGVVRRGRQQRLAIDFYCSGCVPENFAADGLVIGSLRLREVPGLNVQLESENQAASNAVSIVPDKHATNNPYVSKPTFYWIKADRDMPLEPVMIEAELTYRQRRNGILGKDENLTYKIPLLDTPRNRSVDSGAWPFGLKAAAKRRIEYAAFVPFFLMAELVCKLSRHPCDWSF